jgi:hypothetical protein
MYKDRVQGQLITSFVPGPFDYAVSSRFVHKFYAREAVNAGLLIPGTLYLIL